MVQCEEQGGDQQIEEPHDVDNVEITNAEMQNGIPPVAPTLEFDITPLDIQGRAFRDARKEACEKFLEDEAFVRSPTFLQMMWKVKVDDYRKRSAERMA